MHTNSYVPIPVYGAGSRKPRLDPNAPKQRRATQAHSNAARERVIANNEEAKARELRSADAELSWRLRALQRADAERAADYTPIGDEAGAELRRLVNGE